MSLLLGYYQHIQHQHSKPARRTPIFVTFLSRRVLSCAPLGLRTVGLHRRNQLGIQRRAPQNLDLGWS
jgi:hypothetical protein